MCTPREAREYPSRPLVGIGVVLLRPDPASVLLIRRSRPPAEGLWSIPGGAQRLGETAEDAARRELLEETGLACGALHLAGHMDSLHRDAAGALRFHYTILDFCGVWTDGEPVAGGDTASVAWAPLDGLDAFELTEGLQEIVSRSAAILADNS